GIKPKKMPSAPVKTAALRIAITPLLFRRTEYKLSTLIFQIDFPCWLLKCLITALMPLGVAARQSDSLGERAAGQSICAVGFYIFKTSQKGLLV
ncbi:MAG: hypothetical protein RJS98_01435, partial [Rhodospirillaceae bacterium]